MRRLRAEFLERLPDPNTETVRSWDRSITKLHHDNPVDLARPVPMEAVFPRVRNLSLPHVRDYMGAEPTIAFDSTNEMLFMHER